MPKTSRSPAELRDMFGANLRQLARQYRSISDLSRQLGINRTQFNRYLSGESFPRPDVLDRMCSFFDVDARILLEPADSFSSQGNLLADPYLANFVGARLHDIPESYFPNGFYQFSRRSFTDEKNFVTGLIYIFRKSGNTFIRGFESRKSMQQQDLPHDPQTREYRGYLTRHEDGIAAIVSRRNAMTCSFNFLAQAASFENNHWVGYATRTVPESSSDTRIVRLAYEHLGTDISKVLSAARQSGLTAEADLKPFHRRLLKPDEAFR